MSLMLRRGERVPIKGRVVTVTDTAFEHLPDVRDYLREVARRRQTVTYGRLKADLDLPYLVQGMGRLLDLLSEDCRRRGEPSLAALVVNQATGEVGDDVGGEAAAERELVYASLR